VQPLPPEPPMALEAETAALDFHISPLLKAGGLAAQIRRSITDLIRDTHGETIIKLRAFVAGAGDARRVQAEVAQSFTERKLPLPVLSVVQVGALEAGPEQVVIEAVVATRRTLNPQGLAFFGGQPGNSFRESLDHLRQSVTAAEVDAGQVLRVDCFTSRLEDSAAARTAVQSAFPQAGIVLVQAMRDPQADDSTCSAVGRLSKAPASGPVTLLPDQRAALVNAPKLVFTGLQLSFGSYLDDAHEAYTRLERATANLAATKAPVEVNVFALDLSGGAALRKMTRVPPSTLTVQTIEGLPAVDASAGIEAVLAPDVQVAGR
jgi:enamine deaminase RidA (YjgF/YER057c/UK114 family)